MALSDVQCLYVTEDRVKQWKTTNAARKLKAVVPLACFALELCQTQEFQAALGQKFNYKPQKTLRSEWPIFELNRVTLEASCKALASRRTTVCAMKGTSSNKNGHSGELQSVEGLWKEYFADPTHWWDNRADKRNPRAPDFRHKFTRKALWIYGWSTPPWVKPLLNSASEGKMHPSVNYGIKDPQDTTQGDRLSKGHNGKGSVVPTPAREYGRIVQGGGGGIRREGARTIIEAIGNLKTRLEQGMVIDLSMCVEVLRRCLKEKNLKVSVAKQVHGCIIQSGMEQNRYVANNLMSVYIRCGELEDARGVFDNFVEKNVFSWTIMIGGYAKHNHPEEAMKLFKQMYRNGVQPDAVTFSSILKACANPSTLQWGKEVHACVKHAGLESNVLVGNALVHMYAKCGSVDDARIVFGRMEEHDMISWNVMIGGLAEHGFGQEAYGLFLRMQREGCRPDTCTYVSILNPRASTGSLEWVKEVHRHVLEAGLESDLRVGNVLVHMYAKCGSLDDARVVFDRMKDRDVITWNVMIGGLAQHGYGSEAYGLLLRMKQEGLKPDAFTYASILNPCSSSGALEWVKEVHRHVLEAGLESDLRVGNALVHMYAKCGSLDDARVVFDRMEDRDVITWTTIINGLAQHGYGSEAYGLLLRMKQEGLKPDAFTYASILNPCSSTGALEWVKEVHRHVLEAGLESDLRVGNALVHMYAECDSIDDARVVFDRMKDRDVITWNVMISGLAQHGFGSDAYGLLLRMKQEGLEPNAITYVNILNPCSSTGALEWVKEVHRHVLEAGLESDSHVGNALVHMYAKCGSLDDARVVFDRMEDRDVITWTTMISGLAQHGYGSEAYGLLLRMKQEGLKPDAFTYASILNPCSSTGALEWVKEVHMHVLEAGLESDLRLGNALVHMYAKCGSIDDARVVFDRMQDRDVITWTMMIGGLAQHGYGSEAYGLLLRMKQEGLKPDAFTYASILNPCSSTGALKWVKEVHRHVLEAGLESDLCVGNALVHMYAKCGSLDDARVVFDRMEDRDVITWNVMISGLAQHGCGSEALEFFKKMIADGVLPDEMSFVAVLSACSHSGLVEEGRELFRGMTQDYGIEPSAFLCTCMVDILGRAGHLEEAKVLIDNMSVEPSGATWGALLGACRTYGNVELGKLASNELLKLEPKDASAFVLLSNIYAAAGNWEEVSRVRSVMQERGIRKEPGRSWIEVDNKVHDFVVSDTSHPEAKEIFAELRRLNERIKGEGYIPDTRLVLRNIDEDEKELAICSHSEKLAIAYGLMRTPAGEPIRVFKNLRVCSDCHTATKFISKVTEREIVVRDANRFHHFQDGACSCADYW